MDLKVIGRHALFFDDDQMALFVNSVDALVQWNSLSIDRYDVRHLLTTPPSRRSFLHHRSSSPPIPDASLQSDLDLQRFMDLPPSPSQDDDGRHPKAEGSNCYHTAAFSYAGSESAPAAATEIETRFRPPFPLPPALLGHTLCPSLQSALPDLEKTHQIIARTALFVRRQGVQSEFVLRVKQGDNPMFGFLSPGHPLHPYFRYLVDNGHLIPAGKTWADSGGGGGSALSLLGSLYGSAEDDGRATLDQSAPGEGPERTGIEAEKTGEVSKGEIRVRRERWVNPLVVNGSSDFTALKPAVARGSPPDEVKRTVYRAAETVRNRLNSECKKPTSEGSKCSPPFYKRGGETARQGGGRDVPQPEDLEQKEKFKMVIGRSNCSGPDTAGSTSPSVELGVSVDATAAAAILQAATRGIRNPDLSIALAGGRGMDPRASDSGLSKEQKIKAERLKKAKMFLLGLNTSVRPPDPAEEAVCGPWAREGSSEPGSLENGRKRVRSGKLSRPRQEERGRGRRHDDVSGKRRRRGEELEEGEVCDAIKSKVRDMMLSTL